MNSQMTFLALGAKCGLPSGGFQAGAPLIAGLSKAIAMQHRGQGHARESHAQIHQESSSRVRMCFALFRR